VFAGFGHEVAKNGTLLSHYATNSGNLLLTFRDNLSVPYSGLKNSLDPFGFSNPEDGTNMLSRKVGKKLPLLAA